LFFLSLSSQQRVALCQAIIDELVKAKRLAKDRCFAQFFGERSFSRTAISASVRLSVIVFLSLAIFSPA
jgi:hypothetical protein